MKKTILFVVIFIALLVCAVGYSDSRYRTSVGQPAPLLAISKADSLIKLDELRGNYVLLSFWSGMNAPSRKAVNEYTAWFRSHKDAKVKMLNINFDTSQNIYNDLVSRDGLNPDENFHAQGAEAKAIIDNYGLQDGYGSLLINPQGKIVAHNPAPEKISSLVK
ncbi:MAG: redoxin domain-containing protein [Bacteroidales bacterium]|nr:redoxin domain-containing protein [Bacteroidales bacterium]